MTAYLLILSAAAIAFRGRARTSGPAVRRFAILIPAHNEEALIGRLLENLAQLDYPKDAVDVFVVADNSVDNTALLARSYGVNVYDRRARNLQGKGHALRWLLSQLSSEGKRYDTYVVLDADSVVAANFLRRMDSGHESGSQVIQAYYSVLNPSDSSLSALRYIALAAVHYLRPLGRSALGLSCGLKGNGMSFEAAILNRFDWHWFTLTEDVEFHLALVEAGIRVDFAADTWVRADMPITLAQARSQNDRWERGRLHLLRSRVPRLLLRGFKHRSFLCLDAAVEQVIPPLSVPFAVAGMCFAASVVSGAETLAVIAAVSLAGQIVYLLCALWLVRAPARVYSALLYAPVYITWKLGLYARALISSKRVPWVRTARNGVQTQRLSTAEIRSEL